MDTCDLTLASVLIIINITFLRFIIKVVYFEEHRYFLWILAIS